MDPLNSSLLYRLAARLAQRDVEGAVAMFGAQGRIAVEDGDRLRLTLAVPDALQSVLAAFEDVSYSSVIHQVHEPGGDDGVLSGIHRGPFLGCEPSNRRIYLNVQVAIRQGEDGLLEQLTVRASAASMTHQLRGGGDTGAIADALTAEVRYRMWSSPPADQDAPPGATQGEGSGAAAAQVSRPSRRGRNAALLLLTLVILILLAALTGLLPRLQRDELSANPALPTTQTPRTSQLSPPASSSVPTTSASAAGPPAIVTATGPPQVQPGRQVVLPSDVLFGLDSAQLTPQTQRTLSDLAQQIVAAHVTGQIQVNGYTDNLGSAAHGLDLSRQRALVVAQALQAALGNAPVTLLPQGFGDADPIADNATEEGRARNRRVTIVLPQAP